jgi:hypothetical protein
MTMSVVTSVSTVGSKKLPPSAARLPPVTTLAPFFFHGVGDVRLDLLDRLHVDQGADHPTRLEPVGDLHGPGGLGQPLGQGGVDAILHQDAGYQGPTAAFERHSGQKMLTSRRLFYARPGVPAAPPPILLTILRFSQANYLWLTWLQVNSSWKFFTDMVEQD